MTELTLFKRVKVGSIEFSVVRPQTQQRHKILQDMSLEVRIVVRKRIQDVAVLSTDIQVLVQKIYVNLDPLSIFELGRTALYALLALMRKKPAANAASPPIASSTPSLRSGGASTNSFDS